MNDEQLLAEVDDVIRSMPNRATMTHNLAENHEWFGRAAALLSMWNPGEGAAFEILMGFFYNPPLSPRGGSTNSLNQMLVKLNKMRTSLLLQTLGPLNIAVSTGKVFDYFDATRKIIETSQQELFFVDQYLDAEFVSRYLPYAKTGVSIRLLCDKKVSSVLPAVEQFSKQNNVAISIRSAQFHDRYIFVDKSNGYHSGASFKDGGKAAPTTLTQVTDTFAVVLDTYEKIWNAAKVER